MLGLNPSPRFPGRIAWLALGAALFLAGSSLAAAGKGDPAP